MNKKELDELENSMYELTDKQGFKALQFLFFRAYGISGLENFDGLDGRQLFDLLKKSIEYGGTTYAGRGEK